jgi:hypothetical protein
MILGLALVVQSLPLKFDLKVNCPVVKSIIFSKPLVKDGKERHLNI